MYELKLNESLVDDSIDLLKKLIATPSFSKEEQDTALLIKNFLNAYGISSHQKANNIWAIANNCETLAPTILLNSHHDTVRPSSDWTKDPFNATQTGDQLYGIGSNDAGASAVSLLASFIYLSQLPNLPYRLIVAITAEEEISGSNGVRSVLPDLGPIELGIVGEPTEMKMAIAEKGLIVLDCTAHGKAGHAAREEGVNALYIALEDIQFLQDLSFKKVSPLLGPVKLSVTQINAGHQHNVVPESCSFVVDVRTNELYKNEQIIQFLKERLKSEVHPRSHWLNSSGIDENHPVVLKGKALGLDTLGSVTLSDQSLMDFPTIKIGPGKSERSHGADEFILLSEIKHGINTYIKLLAELDLNIST